MADEFGAMANSSKDYIKLAYEYVREECGEIDYFTVCSKPDSYVLKALKENKTCKDLWNNLSVTLELNENI